MSPAAAESLSEPQLRSLLEIELDESALLAPGTSGPLGDHVAYIWIDLPNPSSVTIEVRVGERPVARRDISVAGLASDVAARIVAITASEMVRTQMRPVRVRRAPPPRRPTREDIERASRPQDALTFSGGAASAFLPAADGLIAGPSMSIYLRRLGVSERLFASWLTGPTGAGALRWFEAGLGADYRVWLSGSWRVSLGAAASLSLLHLADVRSLGGVAGEQDTWSARATGEVGLEARLHGPLWLGLTLEPGAVLRPVRYESIGGEQGSLEGAWLGASLGLTIEWLSPGQPAPAR